MKLTADLVEAFAGTFLSVRYDDPMPTPPFHREAWEAYCSDVRRVGLAAPRDHAKSTALTFDYVMASICFRESDYVIIIGSTEPKASEQLSNISEELHNNEDLKREFGIKGFETDQVTEIICLFDDGHRFRILARGAEQKIRGSMWNGKRPNLIICDDMEDDEQVESVSRRKKFRRWFFRAVIPSLSKSGKIRVHGTILHEDSLLSRLRKNKVWRFLFYKAHESYSDFSNILWPERWTEAQLREKQQEFEAEGDAGGYSQEYLNDPQDNADSYLKSEQFVPMTEEQRNAEKLFYVGCDFAISKADLANRTSFTVGGLGIGIPLCIVDQKVGRWDTLEWIAELFYLQIKYNPQIFFVEDGQIWKSVRPMVYNEMYGDSRSPKMAELIGYEDVLLNIEELYPVKDKAVRGRPYQKRMKSGGIAFDTEADWFGDFKQENLRFTGESAARLDDQFDSTSTLCLGLEKQSTLTEEDFEKVDEIEEEEREYLYTMARFDPGRSQQTGY